MATTCSTNTGSTSAGSTTTACATKPLPALAALRALPASHVLIPGAAGYDAARRGWNAVHEQYPAAIVSPTSVDEVSRVVTAARRDGLRIALHTTGHNNGPLGPLADAVLVRTDLLRDVAVDPYARRVRAAGGARWGDVVRAVAQHGQSVLHGSSSGVGVVGYATGGGIGWYARAHGIAAHTITRAQVVLPDGEVVEASEGHNPELLWALRGGGGANFGIVTEIELATFPFDSAYAGLLAWDESRAHEVLQVWAEWATDAPSEVTTSFRILAFPDLDDVPADFRGRRMVVIDGAVLADDRRARRIIASLRNLHPEVDTFGRVPTAGLTQLHMDPDEPFPIPLVTASSLLDDLPVKAVEAFLDVAGDGSDLLIAEIRQLGGALSTPRPDHAALSHVPGRFAVFGAQLSPRATAEVPGPADGPARLVAAVAPWETGSSYLNFVEARTDVSRGFTDVAWDRLRRVRAMFDPSDAMRAVHPIPLPD